MARTASEVSDAFYVPDAAAVEGSALSAFMRYCEAHTGEAFADQPELHAFSVREYRRFWSLFLEWSDLLWEGRAEPVCTDDAPQRAAFFPDVRLSYVENLLRVGPGLEPDSPAVVARHADGETERLTRRELRRRVGAASAALARLGVASGDRVVAIGGNDESVIIAALAAMNVGATVSTAAPDMAAPALLSRFEQLRPSVLFADFAPAHLADVVRALPSLKHVVALGDASPPARLAPQAHRMTELIADAPEGDLESPRLPFNHPQYVLFTSGTTGAPKGLVHGAGGTLLEHVKEHRLHVDLGPRDTLFFHTSPAWMMWHWQLSALASGSAIVLHDGGVARPETLWRVVADEGVTVFGTSPPYILLCDSSGYSPGTELNLEGLRAVLSTGSILHDWQFDWIRENVGPLPVQSISGGTDIIGCFVLGSPNLPVRRGWIQCRSLGLDVQAFTPDNASLPRRGVGELICRNPFPSRPLGLVGDDGRRFHEAYFEQNPGVWTHGDLIEFDDDGHARVHGRSDGVLNIQGVRVGPAEIYRALGAVPEVREALAVEERPSSRDAESRLVLLVVLADGVELDKRLTMQIRREIASYATPMHVPKRVVQVDELPVTHSGKLSERAAGDAVNGIPVANAGALRNPASLDAIRRAVQHTAARPAATAPDSNASTTDRLTAIWEDVLEIAPIERDDDFFELGGTSLTAVALLQTVEDRMGIELPLSTLVYARTPAAMAAVIEGPADARVPPLVLLRPGEGAPPIFLIHSLWGDVLSLRSLTLALRTDRPVYGLQARGLDPRREPHRRVEEMAESYLKAIRAAQPDGPYAIAGYSLGGLVAYEIAWRLVEDGQQVEWLGLVDPYFHHRNLPARERAAFVAGKVRRALRAPSRLPARIGRFVARRLPLYRLRPPDAAPAAHRVERANRTAAYSYRPRPYEGDAFLVAATVRDPDICDPVLTAQRVVRGRLAVERVDCDHEELIREPHVARVAELLGRDLAAVRGDELRRGQLEPEPVEQRRS